MSSLLHYAIPGVPFGCIYALVAVGLVLTYRSTGVFNLAFGAQAYVSAAVFYDTAGTHHWPTWAAFVVSVLVVGPAVGLALDRVLFRFMRTASVTVKLVSALGLLVGIPAIGGVLLGTWLQQRLSMRVISGLFALLLTALAVDLVVG